MNDLTFRQLRTIKPDNRMRSLIRKGRYIKPETYDMLKRQKVCHYCHKSFDNEIPQIHHIIPISQGGTNMINNLMVVHKKCHEILDSECIEL